MRRTPILVRAIACVAIGACLAPACGGEAEKLTEIIVNVDSDLDVPGETDHLHVTVTDDQGKSFEFDRALDRGVLPLTIGLSEASNDARKITIDATLKRADKPALERK